MKIFSDSILCFMFFIGTSHAGINNPANHGNYCIKDKESFLKSLTSAKKTKLATQSMIASFLIYGEACDQVELVRECKKHRLRQCEQLKKLLPFELQ